MIEEYAQHGNLKAYLRSMRSPDYHEMSKEVESYSKDGLREDKMLKFALQIARGMEYLLGKKVWSRSVSYLVTHLLFVLLIC